MIYVRDFLKDQSIFSSPHNNPNPSVSVILPTYRRCKEGLLARAIRSVLAQRFQDFELLVMDDGSTDGSSELIESFREKDPRVIHVRHEHNCGLPALRVDEGIELSRGRYLAFQFDDDAWRENALEDLVREAERHTEPVVVIGRALDTKGIGKVTIPSKDVDIISLYGMNRFANNSVLLPRGLVDQYGMYDPHIGMRRLSDWDLWLRLIQYVPFTTLKQVISDVYEANAGSIALTVPWDESLFRYLHNIPRDSYLTPAAWRDYPVDALKIGEVEVPGEFRRRLYEEQIAPFYLRNRHLFPSLSSFTTTLPPTSPKTVLYTKQTYDVTNEISVTHYDDLANRRGSYKSFYHVLDGVTEAWPKEADLLLLMRTVEEEALDLVAEGLFAGKPVGLHLDDDLFSFYEFGEKFSYLAPGTPYYKNLTKVASQVDAVLVTNPFIGESAKLHNPRIVPHDGTIPAERLPDQIHPRAADGRLRIGYVGSGYRIDEFRLLWDALVQISKEYGDRLAFEFWGLDISALPALSSPVTQKPFTFSYFNYLKSLRQANFDILLIPLLDHPKPRLAKALIKYYETAVAGALGIFSDVPQYKALVDGLTCLKAPNHAESWYAVLHKAIEMDAGEFDLLRRRCLEHVREECVVEARIDLHEAALRALEFHACTRTRRHADGCPRVVYALHSAYYGGAELQLLRRMRLAKQYGIQPVAVVPSVFQNIDSGIRLKETLAREGIPVETAEYSFFTEPLSPADFDNEHERSQVRELLERHAPALVHSVTFIPAFGQVCQEMGIPHVCTLHQVDDDFAWGEGKARFVHCQVVQSDSLCFANRWSQLLEAPRMCSYGITTADLFNLGQTNYLKSLGERGAGYSPGPLRLVSTGTFQPRKQQLETIEALGHLKKEGWDFWLSFYGYTHFYEEYANRCRKAIQSWGLEDCVFIRDFTEDIDQVLSEADILLSLSRNESFPGSITEALAAGVLVVATPVGGVSELITDNVSGVLCNGLSVDELVDGIRRALSLPAEVRRAITEQGRKVARMEMHPYRAANDLFRMYNLALDIRVSQGQSGAFLQTDSSSQAGYVPEIAAGSSPQRPTRTRLQPIVDQPASLMPIRSGVSYILAPDRPDWNGVNVLLEAHGKLVNGKLSLRVCTPGGGLLRVDTQEVRNLHQSGWVALRFAPIRNSAGERFRLEFDFASASPGAVVSLYQSTPPRQKVIRMAQRALAEAHFRQRGGGLYCRLSYSAGEGPQVDSFASEVTNQDAMPKVVETRSESGEEG